MRVQPCMAMADGDVTQPGVQGYEEDVIDVFLEGPSRKMRVFTDSRPTRPVDWPLTLKGRLMGLSLDEAGGLGAATPLTRPATAGENAVAVHPLPQGGEG